MRDFKQTGQNGGIQLQTKTQALTDLRFADDILLFALSVQRILVMVRSLIIFIFAASGLGFTCSQNQVDDDPSPATKSSGAS